MKKHHGLFWEKRSPAIAGIVAAMAYWLLVPQCKLPDATKDLLTSMISIGAIAVGFLATMKAVLFTIGERRAIKQMRQTEYYGLLIDYLVSGIRWSSIMSVFSAVGLLFDLHDHPRCQHVAIALWLAVVVVAIGAYWRIVRLFATILRSD